jgi:hypothetical protein
MIERTFVLIIKSLVFCVKTTWLFVLYVKNDLTFVLVEQIDWTDFCVDH